MGNKKHLASARANTENGTVFAPGMEIKLPKAKAFKFETPPMCPKAHGVTLVIGKRGAGKTVAAVNLIEKMQFDRIFAISPSMSSNKEMMSHLGIKEEDIFPDPDDLTVLTAIKLAVEEERDLLEEYWQKKLRYDRIMRELEDGSSDPLTWNEDRLLEFLVDGELKPPYHKWDGREPMMCLLFDDMLGSGIFSRPRQLNQLAIYHRHLGQFKKGGALGISLFFLIQSYKTQVGGLTRTIRNQATTVILFQTKSEKELEDVAEEVGGEVDPLTFYNVYNRAIREKHDFLFIDLHKKDEHPSMFRRNFDEFLLYDRCDSDEVPVTAPPAGVINSGERNREYEAQIR